MSVLQQKAYRSRYESSVSYSMVFMLLFSLALIMIGIFGYAIPEFGLGAFEAFGLILFGSALLFVGMTNIIMKLMAGTSRNVVMFLAVLSVVFFIVLGLLGSGILEVGF